MTYALPRARHPYVAYGAELGAMAFGASASANVTVTVPPGTATKLGAQALSLLGASPKTVTQLSQIGGSFYDIGTTAYETASILAGTGKLSIQQMVSLPFEAYQKIGETLISVFPDIVEDVASALGTTAKAIGVVGNAIPILGALLGFVAMGLDNVVASQKAASVAAQQACQSWYRPPGPPTRSAAYGGRVPADYLVTTGQTLSAVGQVFQKVGEFPCRLYSLFGSKVAFCSDNTTIQNLLKTGAAKLIGPPGIPADVRAILKMLREAIVISRGDPTSDGGISLWPVYLDLLQSQFKNGNMTWELAGWIYDCDVLPPYGEGHSMSSGPAYAGKGSSMAKVYDCDWIADHKCFNEERCKCRTWERRGFDEFKSVMADWSLTIEPFYKMDQQKAGQLRQTLKTTLAKIKSDAGKPKTLAQMAASQMAIRPISSFTSKTEALKAATKSGASWELFAFAAAALALAGGGYWAYRRQKAGQKGSRR